MRRLYRGHLLRAAGEFLVNFGPKHGEWWVRDVNPGCRRTLTEHPRNTASIRKAIAKSSLPIGSREQLALFSHSWW